MWLEEGLSWKNRGEWWVETVGEVRERCPMARPVPWSCSRAGLGRVRAGSPPGVSLELQRNLPAVSSCKRDLSHIFLCKNDPQN